MVTSTYWPPTMPPTPVAATSSPSAARTRAGLSLLTLAEQPHRLREQPVAGEDRDVLPELDVRGGHSPAELVVVHRRQVVVDQRVRVDQLDRRRGRQDPLGLDPDRAGGGER